MYKKHLLTALLLCCLLGLFAACNKNPNAPEGTTPAQNAVQDDSGNTRPAITNEQGAPITDEAGNLLEYLQDSAGETVLDANGEPETHFVAPPPHYSYGNTIQTALFKYRVPQGWTIQKTTQMRFERGEVAAELQILHKREMDELLPQLQQIYEAMARDAGKLTTQEEQSTLLGQTGIHLKQPLLQDGKKSVHETYVFAHGADVIAFYFIYPQSAEKDFDPQEIFSGMELKDIS